MSDESIESISEFDPEAVKDINVIDSVGKMLGAEIRYIYNTQMNVASGYLKPNSRNKLSEPVVVVNLANAKGDSTMFGLAAFMVEKLRKSEGAQRSGSASSYINGLEGEIREASNKLESNPDLLTEREKRIILPLLFRMQSFIDQTSQIGATDSAGVAGLFDGKADRSKLGNALVFAITEQISKDLGALAFNSKVPLNGLHTEIEQAFLENINENLDVDIETVRGIKFADFLKIVFVDKALEDVKSKPKSTTFGTHARTILKFLTNRPKDVLDELRNVLKNAFVASNLPSSITRSTFKALEAMSRKVEAVRERKELDKKVKEISERNGFSNHPPRTLSADSLDSFGEALLNKLNSLAAPANVLFDFFKSKITMAMQTYMSSTYKHERQQENWSYGVIGNENSLLIDLQESHELFSVFLSSRMDAAGAEYVVSTVLSEKSYQDFKNMLESENFDMNSPEFVSFVESLNPFERRAVFGAIAFIKPQYFADVIKLYVEANYANMVQARLITEQEFEEADEYDTFMYSYSDFISAVQQTLNNFDAFLKAHEEGFTAEDVRKTLSAFNSDRSLIKIIAIAEEAQFGSLNIFNDTTMDSIFGDSSLMSNMLLYSNINTNILEAYFDADMQLLNKDAKSPISFTQSEQEINDWLDSNNESNSDYREFMRLREKLLRLKSETEYRELEAALRRELQIPFAQSATMAQLIENNPAEISHLMDKFNDPDFDGITIEDEESQDKKLAEIDDMSEEEVIKKISQADARAGCFR